MTVPRSRGLLVAVVIVATVFAAPAHAYRLEKAAFSGGAVEASGSGLSLRGTVGEAGLVGHCAGPGFVLALGFWSGTEGATVVAVDPDVPRRVDLDLRAVPNPFNPATEFRFNLAEEGAVALGIYDVSGRRVRTLEAGTLGSGPQAVLWSGTDDNGRAVSSGQYFARLLQDGRTLGPVLKLILLK